MKFIYLFDPLCGWCYAASPAIRALAAAFDVQPYATGLFADSGRAMDADFAAFAWANDQKIHALTGQPFSPAYRQNVLDTPGHFDSRALCNACFALLQREPAALFDMLARFQAARYVDGIDTAQTENVRRLLAENGFADTALVFDQTENVEKTTAWMNQGRNLAQQLQLQGVPQLLLERADGLHALNTRLLLQSPEQAVAQITQQYAAH